MLSFSSYEAVQSVEPRPKTEHEYGQSMHAQRITLYKSGRYERENHEIKGFKETVKFATYNVQIWNTWLQN